MCTPPSLERFWKRETIILNCGRNTSKQCYPATLDREYYAEALILSNPSGLKLSGHHVHAVRVFRMTNITLMFFGATISLSVSSTQLLSEKSPKTTLNIQLEGKACYAMALTIPGLTTLNSKSNSSILYELIQNAFPGNQHHPMYII